MLNELKTGVTVADLPYTIEQRGNLLFKVHAAPVLGQDQQGNDILGREMVNCASVDEIKTHEAFLSVVAERDELAKQLANASAKKK
jgi:hypothetical protein